MRPPSFFEVAKAIVSHPDWDTIKMEGEPPVHCERCGAAPARDTWCDGYLCADCEEIAGRLAWERD